MQTHWLQTAAQLQATGTNFVIVSVLSVKGSTPRDIGARMLVTQETIHGTIGGGHLEWKAMAFARERLNDKNTLSCTQEYPLGATLGQCCGGFVTLLFESVLQEELQIAIFGAGHVGRAIVHCLENIPSQVTWIDQRQAEFPYTVADHIQIRRTDLPVDEVKDLPANTVFLILTHNHQLDFELVEAALKRQDSAYVGVIGSRTKSARFQHKLKQKGHDAESIKHMHCPIGIQNIHSKQPGEIAISVLSQILALKNQIINAKVPTPQEASHENTR